MRDPATEAMNRFGSLYAPVKRAPVFAEKTGQLGSVLRFTEHDQALQPEQHSASRAARKQTF
jgi:hypothetical protein